MGNSIMDGLNSIDRVHPGLHILLFEKVDHKWKYTD